MMTDKKLRKKTLKTLNNKQVFKTEISKRLSSAECEKVWNDSYERLYKMYADHLDLPKGVSMHTDSFIFPAAAIYLSMKEADADIAYDVMKKIMAQKSTKTGQSIAKCCRIPGFKKYFLKMWDSMSHKMFGETAGFKNVFYPKQKDCFRMDIIQCPYNKYLTELGCPELTQLFCDNDIYTYGNLPGLKFTRTKTLGTGGDCCDFKMEII